MAIYKRSRWVEGKREWYDLHITPGVEYDIAASAGAAWGNYRAYGHARALCISVDSSKQTARFRLLDTETGERKTAKKLIGGTGTVAEKPAPVVTRSFEGVHRVWAEAAKEYATEKDLKERKAVAFDLITEALGEGFHFAEHDYGGQTTAYFDLPALEKLILILNEYQQRRKV